MKRSPLLTLFLTIFIDLLGFGIVIPILPVFSKELAIQSGISWDADILTGVVAASYSLMQFVFAPIWGSVSDHRGRRPIILGSVLVTSVGYFILGFSSSFWMLLLARVISGMGSANISAAQAYIADITPPHERAKRMGMIGAAFGLGFVFGPPIGGWLAKAGGMHYIGITTGVLCLFNFVLAWFTLPESLTDRTRDRQPWYQSFQAIGTSLKHPLIGALFLINFIFIAAFSMMQTNASLLWKEQFGLNNAQSGNLFGFIGVCSAVIQGMLIGRFTRWMGAPKLLMLGIVLLTLGITGIPFPPEPWFYVLTALCLLFIALGNGMIMPSVNALISLNTNPQSQGKTLGALQSTGALARGIGPLMAGFLYSVDFHFPYTGAALLLILSLTLAWRLSKSGLGNAAAQGTGS
jgi:DHA1 family tetracycline resistance protein-like MFS transporter